MSWLRHSYLIQSANLGIENVCPTSSNGAVFTSVLGLILCSTCSWPFHGSAVWAAGGFGTTHSCSPVGKAWHLDVRGDHPHDHKVMFVFLVQVQQEVLFLWKAIFLP